MEEVKVVRVLNDGIAMELVDNKKVDVVDIIFGISWAKFFSIRSLPKFRLQRDQEFSIPGFPGRDFVKSRDPRIFRDGIRLKLLSRDFTKKVWV